jgi:acetylornithine deacetylase/succinyl-diaminopimelate desuccinylase-like protein
LWKIARGPGGGASRLAYSKAEAQAVRLAAGWAREARLDPALDPNGNLWAAPAGVAGPLVSSGSHLDTVPDGGRFDGALGVVLALEAAEALAGRAALLVCAAEEAPRFGAGTIGSRLATGALDADALAGLVDADGVSASEGRSSFLAELTDLPRIDSLPLARLAAHIEVHIEQRRELQDHGARLGVVDRVAVPHRHEVVVEGRAGHAGEVPMAARADALRCSMCTSMWAASRASRRARRGGGTRARARAGSPRGGTAHGGDRGNAPGRARGGERHPRASRTGTRGTGDGRWRDRSR